ncbi:hypothetical protein LZ30DRAFT_688291 [Colletotrichum cereale]|nr:hypothetical protein LZ30DRAFT_688291 [Colletotrichum cereale]
MDADVSAKTRQTRVLGRCSDTFGTSFLSRACRRGRRSSSNNVNTAGVGRRWSTPSASHRRRVIPGTPHWVYQSKYGVDGGADVAKTSESPSGPPKRWPGMVQKAPSRLHFANRHGGDFEYSGSFVAAAKGSAVVVMMMIEGTDAAAIDPASHAALATDIQVDTDTRRLIGAREKTRQGKGISTHPHPPAVSSFLDDKAQPVHQRCVAPGVQNRQHQGINQVPRAAPSGRPGWLAGWLAAFLSPFIPAHQLREWELLASPLSMRPLLT